MKVLVEEAHDIRFLKEDFNGKKHYIIEGIFLQADVKNRNGRIYPLDVMREAVSVYDKDFIKKNHAFGELSHSDRVGIDLPRVSHRILSLKEDGKNFIGRAVIIREGYGKIASALLDVGAVLGISSKGLGSVIRREDADIIQDDFTITSGGDIVSTPSAPDAFVSVVMENVDWFKDKSGKYIKQLKEDIKSKLYKPENMEESLLESFDMFLKGISDKNVYKK